MTIYDFMSESPWLTLFLALIALSAVNAILRFYINRPLRHMSIIKHGWPPDHCDADGDFKEEE